MSAPQISRPTLNALTAAGTGARDLNDDFVSTEHLLVGLAQAGDDVADLLKGVGATPPVLLEAFEKVRGAQRATSKDAEGTY